MAVIIVVSADARVGKTALCAALARCLAPAKKVGYLRAGENAADGLFMGKLLSLAEGTATNFAPGNLETAYKTASSGKDSVIIEATADSQLSAELARLAASQSARIILVEAWNAPHPESYKAFAAQLLGVIVNKVPKHDLAKAKETEAARLGASGVSLLGVVPEDRSLLAPSVADIAAGIKASILNNPEKSGRLVENVMLGALSIDSGLPYYNRKAAKAAVLHIDRPDMQLAALETDTVCLVLGGSKKAPIHSVAFKAENKGVPILQSEKSVPDIVKDIETILDKSQFHHEEKLALLSDLFEKNIGLKGVCARLVPAK